MGSRSSTPACSTPSRGYPARTPLVAGGEEGINGLTISNAMHLSAWLGREVELPLDEELYYQELMKRVAVSRRKTDAVSVLADTAGTYNA